MPVLDAQALISNRVKAIRSYHESVGTLRAELDVSGGVDSAVMLMLLVEALGPENVTAVYSAINSSSESWQRARLVAVQAGVKLAEVSATGTYNVLVDACRQALVNAGYDMREIDARVEADPSIMGSLRSTLRAPLGRFMNRLTGGGIRHGTGNECEDRWLRFYQKGGDGEVDTNPIAMLSKGETLQLALALGVSREIVTALPSPDLWGVGDQHNDEDELARVSGVSWTYSRVDPDTNHYSRVGTIERLSRFLDHWFPAWFDSACRITGSWLFAQDEGVDEISGPWKFDLEALVTQAQAFFPGHTQDQVRGFLASARKWEQVTRHKLNPNCPSLGSRESLLTAKILTDTLPEITEANRGSKP